MSKENHLEIHTYIYIERERYLDIYNITMPSIIYGNYIHTYMEDTCIYIHMGMEDAYVYAEKKH